MNTPQSLQVEIQYLDGHVTQRRQYTNNMFDDFRTRNLFITAIRNDPRIVPFGASLGHARHAPSKVIDHLFEDCATIMAAELGHNDTETGVSHNITPEEVARSDVFKIWYASITIPRRISKSACKRLSESARAAAITGVSMHYQPEKLYSLIIQELRPAERDPLLPIRFS